MSEIDPDDLVLVAVLPKRKDLDIARVLGWYRVPLKTAPKMLQVDWIAFYLTGDFGEERWSVRYAAPVKGHELVMRADLLADERDHPAAADPYFKIHLGPVMRLARPIPANRWRRFIFLYTTGAHLLSALDVRDLTLKTAEQRQIREAGERTLDRN
jgi:hypothetical protein